MNTKNNLITIKPQNKVINFKRIRSILMWIHTWYFASEIPLQLAEEQISFVMNRFATIYRTRGPVQAADEVKTSRLVFTKWLSGEPLSGSVGVPISKIDGLPKAYITLAMRRRLQSKQDHDIKFILTCLSISRIIMGGKPVNLDTITAPWTGRKLPTSAEIAIALRSLGVAPLQKRPQWKRFHWMSSAGPNGLSILSSLSDVLLLDEDDLKQIEILGGSSFTIFNWNIEEDALQNTKFLKYLRS